MDEELKLNSPYFIYCEHLIVYRDVGYKDGTMEFTQPKISNCECKRYQFNKSCTNKGRCIIARENNTWKMVSSKSWGIEK